MCLPFYGHSSISSKNTCAATQNAAQKAAIIQAGLVKPLKIELLNPILYLFSDCKKESRQHLERNSQKTADKGAKAEPDPLTQDLPACKRRATTNTNDPWIRAVPLCVHPEREAAAADHTSNEDEIQPVCLVRQCVEDIAQNHASAGEVQWTNINTYSVG